MNRNPLLLPSLAAALLAGCGGASTPPPDPGATPPPAPMTDIGKERAERDAALAARERSTTQQESDAALSGNQRPD